MARRLLSKTESLATLTLLRSSSRPIAVILELSNPVG